ncbi:hypothetical protein [Chitinophaga silvisoli]|uniref:Uncharacterized protein n=1 Tax=Chitinophaga silvisoli TaxID=2291814 RepID=A0A3E1P2R7_9BACT|nr:hypothetical protein [Chitinophaga silvisoli]RFM34481.1 hypothetical protein DXN04_14490 [Chitinophaga silvisoli]
MPCGDSKLEKGSFVFFILERGSAKVLSLFVLMVRSLFALMGASLFVLIGVFLFSLMGASLFAPIGVFLFALIVLSLFVLFAISCFVLIAISILVLKSPSGRYVSSNLRPTSASLTPVFSHFAAFPVISLYTPCSFSAICLYTAEAIFAAFPNLAALLLVPSNAGKVITSFAVRELFVLI